MRYSQGWFGERWDLECKTCFSRGRAGGGIGPQRARKCTPRPPYGWESFLCGPGLEPDFGYYSLGGQGGLYAGAGTPALLITHGMGY